MPTPSQQCIVFPTPLGWMGLLTSGKAIQRLTFGHPSFPAAAKALNSNLLPSQDPSPAMAVVVRRLTDYAEGRVVDFRTVPVDRGVLTDFQRRVMLACREIPYGETITYGQLAAEVGCPGAARAVGNCMAANPVPLIVPCHRVVTAGRHPGPFSAPGGSRMKRRLLRMEASKRIGIRP